MTKREYQRAWFKRHPDYKKNWMRDHRYKQQRVYILGVSVYWRYLRCGIHR